MAKPSIDDRADALGLIIERGQFGLDRDYIIRNKETRLCLQVGNCSECLAYLAGAEYIRESLIAD